MMYSKFHHLPSSHDTDHIHLQKQQHQQQGRGDDASSNTTKSHSSYRTADEGLEPPFSHRNLTRPDNHSNGSSLGDICSTGSSYPRSTKEPSDSLKQLYNITTPEMRSLIQKRVEEEVEKQMEIMNYFEKKTFKKETIELSSIDETNSRSISRTSINSRDGDFRMSIYNCHEELDNADDMARLPWDSNSFMISSPVFKPPFFTGWFVR